MAKSDWEESKELVTVEFDNLVAKGDRAILFDFEGSEEWIPKSLIDNLDEVEDPDNEDNELVIPQWKAEELGLV